MNSDSFNLITDGEKINLDKIYLASYQINFPLGPDDYEELKYTAFVEGASPQYSFSPGFYVHLNLPNWIPAGKSRSFRDYVEEHNIFSLNYGDLFLMTVNIFRRQKEYVDLIESLIKRGENITNTFLKKIRERSPELISRQGILNHSSPLFRSYNLEIDKIYNQISLYQHILSFAQDPNNLYICQSLHEILAPCREGDILSVREIFNNFQLLTNPYMGISRVSIDFNQRDLGPVYYFQDLSDVIIFDMFEMIKRRRGVRKCENCGNYFVPVSRSDEIYCSYPFGEKNCKATGYGNKVQNDQIMTTYRRIYKTQHARKNRNKTNIPDIEEKFSKWERAALEKRAECRAGKCSLDEMKNAISSPSWMFEE